MYCSFTYTMGVLWSILSSWYRLKLFSQNFALLPCLFDTSWDDHPSEHNTCNSYSWRMGVCTCLPGIWRLLQCVRRFRDTGNYFPHLANAGKYACTVLYYASLGWWRVHGSNNMEQSKALFIAFGTINAVYCCRFCMICVAGRISN